MLRDRHMYAGGKFATNKQRMFVLVFVFVGWQSSHHRPADADVYRILIDRVRCHSSLHTLLHPRTMLPILSESAQWVLSPLTSRQTERDEDLQYDFAHDAWAVARRLVLLDRGLDYLASACQGLAVLPDTSTPSVDVGIVRSQLSRTLASDHPQVVVSAAITGFGETRPSDLDKIRINHNVSPY